jgi:hypothetical protein
VTMPSSVPPRVRVDPVPQPVQVDPVPQPAPVDPARAHRVPALPVRPVPPAHVLPRA